MKLAVFFAVLAAQAGPDPQPVQCRAPDAPEVVRLTKPTRPATPSCVDEVRSRHNCRPAIINTYNQRMETYAAEFDTYLKSMNGYVEALNQYVMSAHRFTECERDAAGIVSGIIRG